MSSKPRLTHDECCVLVESALCKALSTLTYIGQRLKPGSTSKVDEWMEKYPRFVSDVLCNINHYGAYLAGARDMILALEENKVLHTPKSVYKYGGRNYIDLQHSDKEERVINRSIINLLLTDSASLWRFLSKDFDEIRFTDVKRDRKGKITGCEACFVKRVTKYQKL